MASRSQLSACWLPSWKLNLLFSYLISIYWVLVSPVQTIGTQWCLKPKMVPATRRERAISSQRGRNINHIVTQSIVNLDYDKFCVEVPLL